MEATKIYISVFNTDGSNRDPSINTIPKLCEFLIKKIQSHFGKSDENFALYTAEYEQQLLLVPDEEPQTQDDSEDDLVTEDSFGSEVEDNDEEFDELSLQMAKMAVIDFDFGKSCLITLSEFSANAAKTLKQLLTKGATAYNFEGHKFKTKDYLASFWSTNWSKIDSGVSEDGKCVAVVLEDKGAKNKIVYISVHLPHKTTDKKKAPQALLDLANNLQNKHQPDEIVIAGDFNMKPSLVKDIFNQLSAQDYTKNIGIVLDKTETTKGGRSIDNVLMKSTSVSLKFVNVDKDDPSPLSHYPLYGVLQ